MITHFYLRSFGNGKLIFLSNETSAKRFQRTVMSVGHDRIRRCAFHANSAPRAPSKPCIYSLEYIRTWRAGRVVRIYALGTRMYVLRDKYR